MEQISEHGKVKVVECDSDQWEFVDSVKDHAEQEQSDLEWSRVTPEWRGVDNKSEEQPWPQLMCYALICCHVCGCIFQED